MMAGWARVGAKCVCIDATDHREWCVCPGHIAGPWDHSVRAGQIYTIRAVGMCAVWNIPVLWLKEVIRDNNSTGQESGLNIARFRPLVTSTLEADSAMFLSLVQRMDAIRIAELALDEFEL